jgi:hypothetical protein
MSQNKRTYDAMSISMRGGDGNVIPEPMPVKRTRGMRIPKSILSRDPPLYTFLAAPEGGISSVMQYQGKAFGAKIKPL